MSRLQISIRSNAYTEALIKASLEKEESMNKTKFIHAAIEKLAYEILGPEEIMNIRLYQQYEINE